MENCVGMYVCIYTHTYTHTEGYRKLCVGLPEVRSATHKTLKVVHAFFLTYSPNPFKLRTLGMVLYFQYDFQSKLCLATDA
jgi:hypothetical protein